MINYTKMINGCLPEDIRILTHIEVPAEFDARFDCK